jgi:hypothetical protein
MTVTDVLTVCDARGVQLIIDGHELRARGRKGAVSDALKQGIIQHKADLIELVYEREEAVAIEDEGKLSNIGRAFLEAQKKLVTVADGVAPELANIALCDEGLRMVAKVFGGLEIISAHREAQEVAA